jgi:hypothetical protein
VSSILEPVAKRLFDSYYRYCSQSGLEELQYLTEEAYKLHERLKKRPGSKDGLYGLDEFLLLKSLRNYSVHQGDFIGEAFGINRPVAERLKLDLGKVCLIKKETVNLAINYEEPLENDHNEQTKVRRIQGQLVDFGEFYNLEPVIFNFIVKVYELLTRLKLSIPGSGFKKLDTAYQRETYFRHNPVGVDSAELLECLVPMKVAGFESEVGLADPELDMWKDAGVLDVKYADLTLMTYSGDEYQVMIEAVQRILDRNKSTRLVSQVCPNYIGISIITGGNSKHGDISCFSVNKQKAILEKHGINIDEDYYDLGPAEFLALSIVDDNLFPVVIDRQDLLNKNSVLEKKVMSENKSHDQLVVSIVDKKKKKEKRSQASKARKVQRKAKK